MTFPADRMLKLMAYADGELDGDERAEVEGWLAADPDARRFVADMANLGELVKEGHEASSHVAAARSFDVADAVMASVAREAPANVVSLDARRPKSWRAGVVVVAALALAASVFFVMRPTDEVPLAQGPHVRVATRQAAPTPSPPVAVASAGPNEDGVEVEPVESQGESVQVFYLANESSPTTSVVVWVDEHGAK